MSPRLQHEPHGEEANIDVRQRCSEHDSERLQDSDVQRGHWKLNSYHVMKKPKYDGKIKQSKTRRSDCKATTFRGSLEDG